MRKSRLALLAAAVAIPLACIGAVPAAFAQDEVSPDGDASSPQDTPAASSPLAVQIGAAIDADPAITTPAEISAAGSLPVDGGGSLQFDAQQRVGVIMFLEADADVDALIAEVAAAGGTLEHSAIASPGMIRLRGSIPAPELDDLAAKPGVSSVVPNLQPFTGAELAGSGTAGLNGAAGNAARTEVLTNFAAMLPTLRPSTDTVVDVESQILESAAADCRSIPVEAAAPHRVDEARAAFGVDGTGITVGVLSDSFETATGSLTTWADDVASGDLPGIGNPCGYETPVEVLVDWPGSDEGRAMAQLVHGIAPGATLKFATGNGPEGADGMAASIDALVTSGVDVIVDDLTWPTETYYQKNVISNAYERARAAGIAVFTSAGNATSIGYRGASDERPISSWQTSHYRPMACPAWALSPAEQAAAAVPVDCLDFDPTAAEQAYDVLSLGASDEGGTEATFRLLGSTGQPLYGVNSVFEVRFFTEVDGSDPQVSAIVPMIGAPYPGFSGAFTVPEGIKLRMVLVRTSVNGLSPTDPTNADAQTELPAVYLGFQRGGDGIAERQFLGNAELGAAATDWVGGSTFGHAADGSAISVAALDWEDVTQVREYSSLGHGTLLFEPVDSSGVGVPSARLASPQIVATPHVAAVDGTRTTFFGGNSGTPEEPVYRFPGTSAAAPHAAAVAALAQSLNPAVRGSALEQAVIDTARGTATDPALPGPVNPYVSASFSDAEVFGTGVVDAMRLLTQVQPAPEPEPEPEPEPGPNPAPSPNPDGASDGGTGTGSDNVALRSAGPLSHTGGQNLVPWFVGGGIVLILLAAGLIWAGAARRQRSSAELDSANGTDGDE